MKKKAKPQKSFDFREFMSGRGKWFVIAPTVVLVLGCGWWAYQAFTVIPPPALDKASPRELVEFLGDSRGLVQMSVNQREQYLANAWQYYAKATPEQQQRLVRELNSMSPSQQRAFSDATAGVVRERMMKHADEYNRLTTPAARQQYVDKTMNDFNRMRAEVAGAGTVAPGMDVINPLRAAAPKNAGELQTAIVNNTTAGERAKAEPFINHAVKSEQDRIAQLHAER